MARGVNKAIIVGNLGDDPELKFTPGGTAVCRLSVATTSQWKDKDGEKQERTEWHRVTIFGKLGEIASEYLRKGSQVYLEGSIRYDKYTGQDGVERYSTQIIADEMQMLGSAKGDGERSERPARRSNDSPANAPRREAPPAKSNDFADDFADDDIPF